MAQEIVPAAEFQALPLEFIISAPLVATVKAQKVAAESTRDFINSFIKDGKPVTVDFSAKVTDTNGAKDVSISAPLLAIVPIPHLRIDSLSVNFKYEITQTVKDSKATDKGVDLSVSTGAALSPWVSATLKGSVSSKSSEESVMNRSGVLDITVHASEAPMPEGLQKILGILANAIEVTPKK
ncbi:MAG: hypothetical protein POELPBGB_01333 [Bacteroidia bacterium]|nr:hypothetical protein [Bacteroidia bacterium]